MSKESGKNSRKLMKNFLRLKLDTEVDIDGMLVNGNKKISVYTTKIFTI